MRTQFPWRPSVSQHVLPFAEMLALLQPSEGKSCGSNGPVLPGPKKPPRIGLLSAFAPDICPSAPQVLPSIVAPSGRTPVELTSVASPASLQRIVAFQRLYGASKLAAHPAFGSTVYGEKLREWVSPHSSCLPHHCISQKGPCQSPSLNHGLVCWPLLSLQL